MIKFEKREAAEAAVKAYELNDDMRVTIPADKRYKIFQKVFDPNASAAPKPPGAPFGGLGGAASSTPAPPPPQKYNTGLENDVLFRMRQAAALRKQQQPQQQQPQEQQQAVPPQTEAPPKSGDAQGPA